MPYQPFLGYLKPEIFLDRKNLVGGWGDNDLFIQVLLINP